MKSITVPVLTAGVFVFCFWSLTAIHERQLSANTSHKDFVWIKVSAETA